VLADQFVFVVNTLINTAVNKCIAARAPDMNANATNGYTKRTNVTCVTPFAYAAAPGEESLMNTSAKMNPTPASEHHPNAQTAK